MKTTIISFLTYLVLCVAVAAQAVPDFSTVKTEKGMIVLNNTRTQAFSFLVPGANPTGNQNSDGSLVISTDSGVVVVYFVKTYVDKCVTMR